MANRPGQRLTEETPAAGISGPAYTPYSIGLVGTNNTLDLIGCFGATVSHLNADAAVNQTTLTLNNGEGVNSNTTTLQDISIGAAENAKVINVNADTLTIDTNPTTAGDPGLLLLEPANTYVSL